MSPPTRVLVLRHGQSEWNRLRRWQGQADIDLDDEGARQAAAAGEVLGAFDAIWASDLARARRTAEIIAAAVGIGPVRTDARLRETHVGPWEGLTHAEVDAGWPGYLAAHLRPEGFEPYEQAAERMRRALVDIAAPQPGGEVLVVSHGGTIRALRRSLHAEDAYLANLSGSWFEVRGEQVGAGDVVPPLSVARAADEVL